MPSTDGGDDNKNRLQVEFRIWFCTSDFAPMRFCVFPQIFILIRLLRIAADANWMRMELCERYVLLQLNMDKNMYLDFSCRFDSNILWKTVNGCAVGNGVLFFSFVKCVSQISAIVSRQRNRKTNWNWCSTHKWFRRTEKNTEYT